MAFTELSLDSYGRPRAISCHAWNADRTQIAFCPNNNELHVAKWDGTKIVSEIVVKEHDQLITSLDWAARTNRIVTCSQDRNAYVWTFDAANETWKPVMVALRVSRSNTCVRWNNAETRFAVANGEKNVAICFFDEEQNFWTCKVVSGNHTSTILAVAWHPSDSMIATACCDGKCRIISVPLKKSESVPVFGNTKGSRIGTVEAVFKVNAWVHCVSFSPSGRFLAFASHDSCLHIASIPADRLPTQDDVFTILCSGLPYKCLLFVGEDKLIAAGHDCNPTFYSKAGARWAQGKLLDAGKTTSVARQSSAMSSAFKKFETATARAGEDSSATTLETIHQNSISEIRPIAGNANDISTFSTTGLDGRLVIWSLPTIESALGNLSLA